MNPCPDDENQVAPAKIAASAKPFPVGLSKFHTTTFRVPVRKFELPGVVDKDRLARCKNAKKPVSKRKSQSQHE
jgi:hypothetical protein